MGKKNGKKEEVPRKVNGKEIYEIDFSEGNIEYEGRTLMRVKPKNDKKYTGEIIRGLMGVYGGYIQNFNNISTTYYPDEDAYAPVWVGDDAKVMDDATIYEGASIEHYAVIKDFSRVRCASIYGYATISEYASVGDFTITDGKGTKNRTGRVRVYDHASISGHATVLGYVTIEGYVKISGNAFIAGNVDIRDTASVSDDSIIKGKIIIKDNAKISECALINDDNVVIGLDADIRSRMDYLTYNVTDLDETITFYKTVSNDVMLCGSKGDGSNFDNMSLHEFKEEIDNHEYEEGVKESLEKGYKMACVYFDKETPDRIYEFTGESMHNHTYDKDLKRIRAVRDFQCAGTTINKGELGGYIESYTTLNNCYDPHGNSWVADNAIVGGDVTIKGNGVMIKGNAKVIGTNISIESGIENYCSIGDEAVISGCNIRIVDSTISGTSIISNSDKNDSKIDIKYSTVAGCSYINGDIKILSSFISGTKLTDCVRSLVSTSAIYCQCSGRFDIIESNIYNRNARIVGNWNGDVSNGVNITHTDIYDAPLFINGATVCPDEMSNYICLSGLFGPNRDQYTFYYKNDEMVMSLRKGRDGTYQYLGPVKDWIKEYTKGVDMDDLSKKIKNIIDPDTHASDEREKLLSAYLMYYYYISIR